MQNTKKKCEERKKEYIWMEEARGEKRKKKEGIDKKRTRSKEMMGLAEE